MLRFFIKVLLFPITLALTLLVAFARFFCLFSGMVLSVIAGAFFLFGVLMLFIGKRQGFIGFSLLAWAISPYGLPGAASWLTLAAMATRRMLAFTRASSSRTEKGLVM